MKHLTAPAGQFYTQAADVEPTARIFVTQLSLADIDSEDNWRLSTQEERDAVLAEVDALLEDERRGLEE